MTQKIAVAIIHGIGDQDSNFAHQFSATLKKEFQSQVSKLGKNAKQNDLEIEGIHWAPIVEEIEQSLWDKLPGEELKWPKLRKFVISYLGDAIAYQPPTFQDLKHLDKNIYKKIHDQFNQGLRILAVRSGNTAPLCVVAHSLGTVISSNYFYNIQTSDPIDYPNSFSSPLVNGETFTSFFTLGSPIPLWGLRYKDFGIPITVPSPQLIHFHPNVEGDWLNFYGKHDVLSYPLKNLNKYYQQMVREDIQVNIGSFLYKYSPLSHLHYWKNDKVIKAIAHSLAKTWIQVNEPCV